jgi:hypothetical protein
LSNLNIKTDNTDSKLKMKPQAQFWLTITLILLLSAIVEAVVPNGVLRATDTSKAVATDVEIDDAGNLTVPGSLTAGANGTNGAFRLYDHNGDRWVELTAPDEVLTNNYFVIPDRLLGDGSILKVFNEGSSNIVDAAVVNTDYTKPATESGTHSTPTTGNPLSPTWEGGLYIIWYGATGTINLPAVSGYQARGIIIYNTGAFTITIDSNGSEVIVRDGTAQTGGVSMTLSSGAGNYVCLISDGNRWVTLGYKGTLAVGS